MAECVVSLEVKDAKLHLDTYQTQLTTVNAKLEAFSAKYSSILGIDTFGGLLDFVRSYLDDVKYHNNGSISHSVLTTLPFDKMVAAKIWVQGYMELCKEKETTENNLARAKLDYAQAVKKYLVSV